MNKAEILRYLRTSSSVQDEQLLNLIEEQMALVNKTVQPKSIYGIFDCTVTENSLIIGEMQFRSIRLAQNLKGCRHVAVLAATLGTEGDRLLRTYANEGARLAVMQAVPLFSTIWKPNAALKQEADIHPAILTLIFRSRQKCFPCLKLQNAAELH